MSSAACAAAVPSAVGSVIIVTPGSVHELPLLVDVTALLPHDEPAAFVATTEYVADPVAPESVYEVLVVVAIAVPLRNTLYFVIGEPPLLPSDQEIFARLPLRVTVTAGADGAVGSAGSNSANMRRPPVCRRIEATAEYEFPRAAAGPWMQPPTQPSAYPTSMRPCLSTVMSLKSSRLRDISAPPASQIGPRCTGSFGVALTRCQVEPAS